MTRCRRQKSCFLQRCQLFGKLASLQEAPALAGRVVWIQWSYRAIVWAVPAETGQVFTDDALAEVWQLTRGQPWLVNALAKVAVEELVPDVTQAVTVEDIEAAKELLILRRQTRLDQLSGLPDIAGRTVTVVRA